MKFVQSPNLPKSRVTAAAVSINDEKVLDALKKCGVKCITVTPYLGLDFPVQTHADMLLHHLGANNILVADGNASYISALVELGFSVSIIGENLHKEYPHPQCHTLF